MTRRKDDWPETLEKFHVIAAERGIRNVSPDIPAGPKTVYRLIKGETRHPTKAVRAGIERIVRESEDSCRRDTEPPETPTGT